MISRRYILFQNGGLGDFLMALFLSEQLKKYAGAESISILLHKNGDFLRQFAEEYPYISVIEISVKRPLSLFKIMKLFGSGNTVILPPTIGRFPLRLKIFARLLAFPFGKVIGFQDSGLFCSALYSKNLPYKLDQDFAESMRDILRALNFPVSKEPPRLYIKPKEGIIKRLGLSNSRYVFFHPRGGSNRRRLSENDAVRIVDCILSLFPERKVVLSGAEYERREIESIVGKTRDPKRVIPAIGFSPAEISALILGSELFIGMDTGVSHLSCFLGVRTLIIAQNATANWLPYYHPGATILYRLSEDKDGRKDRAYMLARQNGRIRPFGIVPVEYVCKELEKILKG